MGRKLREADDICDINCVSSAWVTVETLKISGFEKKVWRKKEETGD